MGSCCESTSPSYHFHHQRKDNSNEKFPDMPLWNNGKKVGYGIKEMPAYKCDLKINELEKKRKIFWNYQKNHGRHTHQWNIMHQACVFPHIKSEEFLAEHGFKTLEGCINMCVDPEGNIFRVPNYCINDPYFELELLNNNEAKGENIEIKLFDVVNQKQIKLNVLDSITGGELIAKYANEGNIDLNKNKIRLLFGGGIIKENETLFQHKVKNGFSIQICISPI